MSLSAVEQAAYESASKYLKDAMELFERAANSVDAALRIVRQADIDDRVVLRAGDDAHSGAFRTRHLVHQWMAAGKIEEVELGPWQESEL